MNDQIKEESAQVQKPAKKIKKDKEKAKLGMYDPRGVQTLFRTLSRNHYNLLRMVDNKASIILTINSIIISLLMGAMYIAPDEQKVAIAVGAKILINFSMLSMVFAVISMLPHRYIGRLYKKSSYRGSLYAGNFSSLSLDEFKGEFDRIMDSGQNIYDEMIKDLYFLGIVISGKQKMLLFSTVIFLIGLISATIYSAGHGLRLFGN